MTKETHTTLHAATPTSLLLSMVRAPRSRASGRGPPARFRRSLAAILHRGARKTGRRLPSRAACVSPRPGAACASTLGSPHPLRRSRGTLSPRVSQCLPLTRRGGMNADHDDNRHPTGRQTESKQTDRQTDTQTDGQTDKQTDTQKHKRRERERARERERESERAHGGPELATRQPNNRTNGESTT